MIRKRRWIIFGILIACCSIVGAIVIPTLFSNSIVTTTEIGGYDYSILFEQRPYAGGTWSTDPQVLEPEQGSIMYQVRVNNQESYSCLCYFQMTVTCSKGFTVGEDGNINDFWGLEVDYGNASGGMGWLLLHSPEMFNVTINETGVLIITTTARYEVVPGITPDPSDFNHNVTVDVTFNPHASGIYSFDIKAI